MTLGELVFFDCGWLNSVSIRGTINPAPACAVAVASVGGPYPGAEVHRWLVTTKLQHPNGCEAAEADAAVRKAMAPLVGRDDWEYASGRAGERWRAEYDYQAEAQVWRCEVRRV